MNPTLWNVIHLVTTLCGLSVFIGGFAAFVSSGFETPLEVVKNVHIATATGMMSAFLGAITWAACSKLDSAPTDGRVRERFRAKVYATIVSCFIRSVFLIAASALAHTSFEALRGSKKTYVSAELTAINLVLLALMSGITIIADVVRLYSNLKQRDYFNLEIMNSYQDEEDDDNHEISLPRSESEATLV